MWPRGTLCHHRFVQWLRPNWTLCGATHLRGNERGTDLRFCFSGRVYSGGPVYVVQRDVPRASVEALITSAHLRSYVWRWALTVAPERIRTRPLAWYGCGL
jgi:hypothetical protein